MPNEPTPEELATLSPEERQAYKWHSGFERLCDPKSSCSVVAAAFRDLMRLRAASAPRLIESAPRGTPILACHKRGKWWLETILEERYGNLCYREGNVWCSHPDRAFSHWLPAPPAPTPQPPTEAKGADRA